MLTGYTQHLKAIKKQLDFTIMEIDLCPVVNASELLKY